MSSGNGNGKVLDLRQLRNRVAGKVCIDDGDAHDVFKMNGVQYQKLSVMQPEDPATLLYELAAELVPTADREVLWRCDKDEIRGILAMASQGIEAAKSLFPNAESPEPPTSPG